ncbi:MAG TPA: Hsp20/alpha crystallin family protein [Terrimicrobiaceae bacterium]|nr:Hsp20/alpha crystallin family protein [Terrimicrobiaceae bacterium]
MEKLIKFKWFHSQLEGLTYELSSVRFAQAEGWRPAMNAYRCRNCVRICFDLAGVDRADIQLGIEPTKLTLRGTRPTPEPAGAEGRPQQILAMEIDHGHFSREVHFPAEVIPGKAIVEQRDGLLWIDLPLNAVHE